MIQVSEKVDCVLSKPAVSVCERVIWSCTASIELIALLTYLPEEASCHYPNAGASCVAHKERKCSTVCRHAL